MKTKDIKQEVFIAASPVEVYQALMDSKIHSAFTGDIAKIGKKEGDSFSAFDGYATGKNLKLQTNTLIVQSWRASDWPNGHYSTVRFELKAEKNGTSLLFSQRGVPEEQAKDVSDGWKEYYWEPMKAMFAKANSNK